MPKKGLLKLCIKFALRSHMDHAALNTCLIAGSYLPEYISPKRLNGAFEEVV